MRKTGREQKRRFGFLAYLWNTLGSVFHTDMHRFQVTVDGKPIRVHASEMMIANCKFMGLQPQLDGVEIDPDDGRLDMFIIRTQSFRDYLGVIASFILRRKAQEDPNLRYIEARKSIEIKSEFPLPAQADGEVIGTTPVNVNLIPNALRIIIPKPAQPAAEQK
jgi:diacylglycerol kinase family enzyme